MTTTNPETNSLIPIIDFETCGLHRETLDMQAMIDVGKQMKDAMSSVGFCYLKNHGIDPNAIQNYYEVSKEFFDMSVEKKSKHARAEGQEQGWIASESEKLNPDREGDLKEAYNYMPSDDTDGWQTPEFQRVNKDMFHRCKDLANRLFDTLSIGMGLEQNFMRDAHKLMGQANNYSKLRALYYPPLGENSTVKPGQERLGEHTDFGTFGLLFQDDIGGLEVKIPGKGYVPATPIPGTIVVNIGDMMQMWTADKLIATKHRVMVPETKSLKTRQSFAFFTHPDGEYIIKCLDNSDKYKPVSSLDHLNYKVKQIY